MRRGFVELDGLFIHWRAIGQGPALVLLHESPRSSASLIPLMKRLSNDFCCIAFDTPGYGASDPLPEGVKSLTEFACVIRQTIASLGIETFCLYGTHTGAAIALQLAELMPERVTSLLLDGLAIFSEQEQQDFFQHYLIPHEPKWDGSHLMTIWSRIRDQAVFFPFYSRSAACRLVRPNNDLDFMLRTCVGFLEAGNNYDVGYRAAIAYDPREPLHRIELPCRLHVKEFDLLAPHLQRIKSVSSSVKVSVQALPVDRWLQATREWFSDFPSRVMSAETLPQHKVRRFIDTIGGAVFVATGAGNGLRVRSAYPAPRPEGLYSPCFQSAAAGWFADAPECGVNASVKYDPAQIARTLGTELWDEQIIPTVQSLPAPDYHGAFLTGAWFAARDALLQGQEAAAKAGASSEVSIKSLTCSHMAMLYSHLNTTPDIV